MAIHRRNGNKEKKHIATAVVDQIEAETLHSLLSMKDIPGEPLTICNRVANIDPLEELQSSKRFHAKCQEITNEKPILVLQGPLSKALGRTGNNLLEFMNAIQFTRDTDIHLGIIMDSWPMQLFKQVGIESFLGKEGVSCLETNFCVKVFRSTSELKGWNQIHLPRAGPAHLNFDITNLFYYHSPEFEEYISTQKDILRILARQTNTEDHCKGINAMFDSDPKEIKYTAVHMRQLEDDGEKILGLISKDAGCDPKGALDMTPSYIKSILKSLDMMDHSIVIITDHQRNDHIQALIADDEIGPMVRVVPNEASSIGSDMTLATMATVFIG